MESVSALLLRWAYPLASLELVLLMSPLPMVFLGWLKVPRAEAYAPLGLRLAGMAIGWLLPLLGGLAALHHMRDQLSSRVPLGLLLAAASVGIFPLASQVPAILLVILLPWIFVSLVWYPLSWAGWPGIWAAAALGAPKPYLVETVASPIVFFSAAAALVSGLVMARAWFAPSILMDLAAILTVHNLIQFGVHTVLPGLMPR